MLFSDYTPAMQEVAPDAHTYFAKLL